MERGEMGMEEVVGGRGTLLRRGCSQTQVSEVGQLLPPTTTCPSALTTALSQHLHCQLHLSIPTTSPLLTTPPTPPLTPSASLQPAAPPRLLDPDTGTSAVS